VILNRRRANTKLAKPNNVNGAHCSSPSRGSASSDDEQVLDDMERMFDLRGRWPSDAPVSVMRASLFLGSALLWSASWPRATSPLPRYFRRSSPRLDSRRRQRGGGLVAVQQRMCLRHIETSPAVLTTVCTRPEAASTPMCAFIPKCQSLPFFD
jgi:hypothetical protein